MALSVFIRTTDRQNVVSLRRFPLLTARKDHLTTDGTDSTDGEKA